MGSALILVPPVAFVFGSHHCNPAPPPCGLLGPSSFPGVQKSGCLENSPAPYRSLRALRARSASGSVRESVSKNRGVPESVWGNALGALLKVT